MDLGIVAGLDWLCMVMAVTFASPSLYFSTFTWVNKEWSEQT